MPARIPVNRGVSFFFLFDSGDLALHWHSLHFFVFSISDRIYGFINGFNSLCLNI